jgi:hypothetical protein
MFGLSRAAAVMMHPTFTPTHFSLVTLLAAVAQKLAIPIPAQLGVTIAAEDFTK